MTERQPALNDALRALERSEPLTGGALAKQLHVGETDVHILMLSAQANRLVYRMTDGEWAITERGRRTLEHPDPTQPRPLRMNGRRSPADASPNPTATLAQPPSLLSYPRDH